VRALYHKPPVSQSKNPLSTVNITACNSTLFSQALYAWFTIACPLATDAAKTLELIEINELYESFNQDS
jgi:hypothetical protein